MQTLKQNCFTPFKLTEIKPEGWLRNQLEIQLNGLSGNLDLFYPQIQDSLWFGGKTEGWERAPYWLDGVIPLAWLLDNEELKKRITGYINYIIANQFEDGWLGPRKMVSELATHTAAYDIWSLFLAAKFLTQYHKITGDEKVFNCIRKLLKCIDRHIDRQPLFNWGHSRWFESLIAIIHVYEIKPEKWLFDLAVKLKAQGFDWKTFFEYWPCSERTEKTRWNYMSHAVNNTMALKSAALWWKFTGKAEDKMAAFDMIEKLDNCHGTAVGIPTGDECLAGKNPVQGTELCAIVEYMYSLEILCVILGTPSLCDRLEKIAFNALPAAFTDDMWAHQYDQQVNQIECSVKENRTWTDNRPDANIFGLEPDTACCTANFSQGWPKFAAHLYMKTLDGGIAIAHYAPSSLTTMIESAEIKLHLDTNYPFGNSIDIRIHASKKVKFPLLVRIPEWSGKAKITIDGQYVLDVNTSGFYRVERGWNTENFIHIEFEMKPKLTHRGNSFAVIERGSLVFSLPIGEKWVMINDDKELKQLPHGDWEVYPETPWNYALDDSSGSIEKELSIEECSISNIPFSVKNPPVKIKTKGRKIPEWKYENGSAGTLDLSDIKSASEPLEALTLVPYGCAKLRITEFPLLKFDATDKEKKI